MSVLFNQALKKILPKSWLRVIDNAAQHSERLDSQEWKLRRISEFLIRQQYGQIAHEHALKSDVNQHEFGVYSQSGEDGILAYIFSKVGATHRYFVEFGIGDGSECNTANLSINFGWKGLLLDREEQNVAAARLHYQRMLKARSSNVNIVRYQVTAENINQALIDNGPEGEIDLLSIDIDGNDYWVWKAITVINPRVVVIEYNAALGDEESLVIKYDPNFRVNSWVNYGASLAALTKLAHSKDYVLVGCESRGVNAVFVRRDTAAGRFTEVSIKDAYHPNWWLLRLERSSIQLEPIQRAGFVEV